MTTQFAKDNYEMEELDTALKKRLWSLMTEEEKKMPYKFANRVGLGKSTFHTIWTKSSTSIHKKTAEKIAQATGTDPDWIQTGAVKVDFSPNNTVSYSQDLPLEFGNHRQSIENISKPILWEAITIVEDVLEDTNRVMTTQDKAEFIMKVCEYLALRPDMDFDQKQAFIDGLKIA